VDDSLAADEQVDPGQIAFFDTAACDGCAAGSRESSAAPGPEQLLGPSAAGTGSRRRRCRPPSRSAVH
jgi:molybdopterin biosynthesis enzyme